MNESILDNTEQFKENELSDTEFVNTNTEYSEDNLESVDDSIGSNGNLSFLDETTASVENGNTETVVYTSEPTETYYNAELGGYPVVIIQDLSGDYGISLLADYEDYYTTLNTTWENYFSGVLANMGNTDYVAYCLRDYVSSSYSSYTDHYVLYYDVVVDDGELVSGTYPFMDIYRSGSSSEYVCSEGVGTLSSIPFPAYASFGSSADLRKGVSHDETWAVLFAIGFAVVYSVCSRLFDTVSRLRNRG